MSSLTVPVAAQILRFQLSLLRLTSPARSAEQIEELERLLRSAAGQRAGET